MKTFAPLAVAIAALISYTALATGAEGLRARGGAAQTPAGGVGAGSQVVGHGSHGAFAGRRGVAGDGHGNVTGAAQSGFTTDAGGHGQRGARFDRSSDGSLSASNDASATFRNGGSAGRDGSFTRNSDGSASGQRSTTATNANTGVTYEGSSTYTKGSGVSHNASCIDATGNTVTCGSR